MTTNNSGEGAARQSGKYETVLVEYDEGIAWVTMNRPDKRNAMSPTLNREMLEVLEELEVDDSVGVVVLTGAGDSWTAGMDLKEYFRETDYASAAVKTRIRRAAGEWQWRKLRHYPKPTIAMVNGWCFGGAFTPLVSCDLAIAADEATFGVSEINWGIIPGGNVTKALSEAMSHKAALYYIMTGEPFDGRLRAKRAWSTSRCPSPSCASAPANLPRCCLPRTPRCCVRRRTRSSGSIRWIGILPKIIRQPGPPRPPSRTPKRAGKRACRNFWTKRPSAPASRPIAAMTEGTMRVSFEAVGSLLRPKSVAIIGVSEDEGSMGGRSLRNIDALHFSGDVHLVSRTSASVGGRQCIPTIDELPQGVDAAIIALPAKAIIPAIEACARRGIGGAVVYAAGFAEAGEEGIAAQARLAAIAREADIALLGPNTLGLSNYVDGNVLAFGPNGPEDLAGRPAVAILAQSGAMMGSVRLSAKTRRYGVTYAVATGNEAVTSIEDYMAHIVEDPHTRAIALFAEQCAGRRISSPWPGGPRKWQACHHAPSRTERTRSGIRCVAHRRTDRRL